LILLEPEGGFEPPTC